jgi:predicted RNA-binding Zn-ribbon protein involved in translation (DUF1610 family)
MATALTKAEAGFSIGATCPGCGGEVELSQDFFVTTCRHCGSVLRLLIPQAPTAYIARPKIQPAQARAALDRYLKEQQRPLTGPDCETREILYPYWKLDALTVKVRMVTEEIPSFSEDQNAYARTPEKRIRRTVALAPLTLTVACGPPDPAMPATIGLRADYLKLRPFESGDQPSDYSVMPVTQDGDVALERIQSSTRTLDSLVGTPAGWQHRTELVGTRASVIYMPYVVLTMGGNHPLRAAVDAVSGRVVSCGPDAPDIAASAERSTPVGHVGLELHRCTTCGEDLPGKASLVYCCRNCGKITMLGGAHGSEILCAAHNEDDLLVPFWRCSNSIVPAFRISNAEAMYRLAQRITGADGKILFEGSFDAASRLAPAGVTPDEAIALDQIITFREQIEANPRASFQLASKMNRPTDLLFIPFQPRDYFWVDSILDTISFERALLR